jgi:hypothetical protein
MVVYESYNGALVKVTGTPMSGRSDIVLWTGKPDTSLHDKETMRSFEIVLAVTRKQMKDFRFDFHDPNRSGYYPYVHGVKLIGSLKPPVEGSHASS